MLRFGLDESFNNNEDVLLLAECSLESEWEGQVRYLPL